MNKLSDNTVEPHISPLSISLNLTIFFMSFTSSEVNLLRWSTPLDAFDSIGGIYPIPNFTRFLYLLNHNSIQDTRNFPSSITSSTSNSSHIFILKRLVIASDTGSINVFITILLLLIFILVSFKYSMKQVKSLQHI